MVWYGGSKPLVVPTRWDLLGVALGGAPVWSSSGGVGFTEKSVVRRPPCYLPLEQLRLVSRFQKFDKFFKELQTWDLAHVDLICTYSNSIRQQHPGGAIMQKDDSLTCTTMIDPVTGWFKILEILTFDLDEVTGGNDEYIDKSYARVKQMFNNTWLCR